MSRKSPNLTLSLPQCPHCGRHWRPAQGAVADAAHCRKCSAERQAVAAPRLGLTPITAADLTGNYLLPRHLRPR
ncbi:putative Zn-ribbon and HTH transcriptional regulator [Rhizorhapis suberifaciens]|uniref:Putative Zn-ribbon and HTH transcriptional regulator n=1 Tax=Rhizorhapis suberifaciens TaxID=13656 RepID=A0A840HYL9_9SPHN|nr:putative Zn-ribbon and HTH transcriptional regulator [Rhizorhapis suberifaciens]